jgi:hypothetical protein
LFGQIRFFNDGGATLKAIIAQRMVKGYLRSHFIPFTEDQEDGTHRITMLYKGDDSCPSGVLEGCIYFFDNDMEARVFYSEAGASICRNSEHIEDLMRLFNFCHARIFPRNADGMGGVLYEPEHLYTPAIYLTEDGCYDITLTTLINYDFFEVAPLETEDYITAACPELMNKLSIPIFDLLTGEIDIDEAIGYIKEHILGDY